MADQDSASAETLLQTARACLERADAVWRAQAMRQVPEALNGCDDALAGLTELAERAEAKAEFDVDAAAVGARERTRLEAALLLKRGHLLELRAATEGRAEAMVEALRGYERAIDLLAKDGDAAAVAGLLAGAWLNRGNALLALGTAATRAEAVRSYDRSIVLLGGLAAGGAAVDSAEVIAWRAPLGAAWLNRGVALRASASDVTDKEGERLRAEAARAFERAIVELAPCAGEHAGARRNLGAAWTNLGLLRLGGDPRGAVEAHARALAISGETGGENDRAALWLNLGQARRAASDAAGALEALRGVLILVATREKEDLSAADIGLRARHAACTTLCDLLAAEGEAVTEATRGRLAEAAALVDDGLGLLRELGGRAAKVGEPGARLFEFGAWLYRNYGEGQLAAYLTAHLEPVDARKIEIAGAALATARQEIVRRGFQELMGESAARIGDELAGLRAVETRLRELASRDGAALKT